MSRPQLTRTSTRSAAARLHPTALVVAVQSRTAGGPDAGMTTAEYAVGTVAACGFGGVLYKVISSPQILDLVKSIIGKAFHLSF